MSVTLAKQRFLGLLTDCGLILLLGAGAARAQDSQESPFQLEPSQSEAEVPYVLGEAAVGEEGAPGLGAGCGAACSRTGCSTCGADPGCCRCGPLGRLWLRSDYLIWWTKGTRLPALVTSSPPSTPRDQAGVLGEPFTTVAFGDQLVNNGGRQGYRVSVGYWLDDCRRWSLEGDYFDIGGQSRGYDSGPCNGTQRILARPIYNALAQEQAAELVCFPGEVSGQVRARAADYFNSAGAWSRINLACCSSGYWTDSCAGYMALAQSGQNDCFRMDMILGYRYYRLGDSVTVREDLVSTGGVVEVGTTTLVEDSFRALNEYHGAELGITMEFYRSRWSLDLLAKMALGNNHQVVTIDGRTVFTPPDEPPISYGSGVLALVGTNAGTYDRDTFVVIPQFGAELGYQVTCRLRAFVGYDFIYWAHVSRAADQIDLRVNPDWLPPPLQQAGEPRVPAFNWTKTDFWAQGLSLGLELRY